MSIKNTEFFSKEEGGQYKAGITALLTTPYAAHSDITLFDPLDRFDLVGKLCDVLALIADSDYLKTGIAC